MKPIAIVHLLLGIIAFGFGIYMLFDEALLSALGPTMRAMFIGLLLVYGAFRLFTAMREMRTRVVSQ
jgi:hypothetical protein